MCPVYPALHMSDVVPPGSIAALTVTRRVVMSCLAWWLKTPFEVSDAMQSPESSSRHRASARHLPSRCVLVHLLYGLVVLADLDSQTSGALSCGCLPNGKSQMPAADTPALYCDALGVPRGSCKDDAGSQLHRCFPWTLRVGVNFWLRLPVRATSPRPRQPGCASLLYLACRAWPISEWATCT